MNSRSISPPPKRRRVSPSRDDDKQAEEIAQHAPSLIDLTGDANDHTEEPLHDAPSTVDSQYIESPIKLNFIQEFPAKSNVDCISLVSRFLGIYLHFWIILGSWYCFNSPGEVSIYVVGHFCDICYCWNKWLTPVQGSILGNPLIKECWLFNYLYDVEFILW